MVVLKYKRADKKEYLVTVRNADDLVDSGIKHIVLLPMTGSFAEKWSSPSCPYLDYWWQEHEENSSDAKDSELVLRSSHHKDTGNMPLFPTLRARFASGEVKWSANPRLGFEFAHIPYYWEWLEDVLRNCRAPLRAVHLLDAVYASLFLYECNTPLMESFCELWCAKTNTLVTASGEVSISLWDMRVIAGLPITGTFYDEVVPSHTELLHSDKGGRTYLPPSCKYLFMAFHRIVSRTRGKVKVTFEDWCRFWFKGKSVYSVCGKDSRLPIPEKDFSCYGKIRAWDDNIHSVFQTLDIPETDRRQTYLAAFLSCWLCAFALPLGDLGHIRVTVFKAASLLASGQTISLAIPVLSNIYRGLNDISTSVSPGRDPAPFAAHYVYSWLASYYNSHKVAEPGIVGASMVSFRGQDTVVPLDARDAKEFIYSGRKIDWRCTSLGGLKNEKLCDDPRLSRHLGEFFTAMRSCYLTLRHENNHVIEPYSPHRFARQFGFLQDVPGELECDVRDSNHERMFQFFDSSIRLGTQSKFIILRNGSSRTSSSYDAWWKKITPTLFDARTSRSADDKWVEKSLLAGGKRKSGSVGGASSSGQPDVVENTPAKRPMRIKIRPSEPETDKDLLRDGQPLPHKDLRHDIYHTKDAANLPPDAQNFIDRSPGENILGILEDDIHDTEDCFTSLRDDKSADTEIAAFNLSSFDVTDQDLIDAVNDPVIFHAAASLSLKDMIDEVKPSPVPTPSGDVQEAIRQADRNAAVFVINSLREKLLRTLISDLPSCVTEVEQYFDYATAKGAEVSVLQAQVKKYLGLALKLQSARRSFLDQSSVKEQISVVKEKLCVNTSLEKQARDEIECIRENLRTTTWRQAQLNEELAEVNVRVTQLNASLVTAENTHSGHVGERRNLLSEQSSLEGSLAASSGGLEELQGLEHEFAEEQAILKDLAWSP